MAERMPALFIGHGNPMNALLVNPYTQRWAAIGGTLPKPKAILSLSAHWYVEGAAVTVSTGPRTIHDFGGFPRELYRVQYPAPGNPNLAERVQKLLAPVLVRRDDRWGSTTAAGRFCDTSIHKPMFPWFNSALMKRNRRRSILKSANAWHLCGKKAFSLWEAATLYIICMPMLGDGTRPSRTTGRSRLKLESASCSSPESTNRSSVTSISSAAKRNWQCPPRIITCRCFTLPGLARPRSRSRFLLKCRWRFSFDARSASGLTQNGNLLGNKSPTSCNVRHPATCCRHVHSKRFRAILLIRGRKWRSSIGTTR